MDREVYETSVGKGIVFTSVGKGIVFSTPHTYITTAFGGDPKFVECAEDGLSIIDGCSDLRVCVLSGTRQFDQLVLQLPTRQIFGIPSYAAAYDAFVNNTCNVIIAAFLELCTRMSAANYSGDFVFSQDSNRFGLEPWLPQQVQMISNGLVS